MEHNIYCKGQALQITAEPILNRLSLRHQKDPLWFQDYLCLCYKHEEIPNILNTLRSLCTWQTLGHLATHSTDCYQFRSQIPAILLNKQVNELHTWLHFQEITGYQISQRNKCSALLIIICFLPSPCILCNMLLCTWKKLACGSRERMPHFHVKKKKKKLCFLSLILIALIDMIVVSTLCAWFHCK